MSDPVLISLIGTIGSLLTVALGIINTRMNLQNQKQINLLEKNTNSIKDALVKVTGESEHAKGKLEGAAEEKGRTG
jgi:hypothetical protein